MPDDCVFCKIVSGQIPGHKVYDDDIALAFLDINPLTSGHLMVVPKRHTARLVDLNPDEAAGLFRAVHRILAPLASSTGMTGATVAVNDGPDAGQEVPHVHVHVVPRRSGDGYGPIHALFGGGKVTDPEGLRHMADSMRAALGQVKTT